MIMSLAENMQNYSNELYVFAQKTFCIFSAGYNRLLKTMVVTFFPRNIYVLKSV